MKGMMWDICRAYSVPLGSFYDIIHQVVDAIDQTVDNIHFPQNGKTNEGFHLLAAT